MKLKKKSLRNSYLYLLIDKKVLGDRLVSIASEIKKLEIDIVQYRDKISDKETVLSNAKKLKKLFLDTRTLFIINDYAGIAKLIDCDGVHLGQEDLPIKTARRLLGENKIIGVSCHNLRQAQSAEAGGADYISIGPIFLTPGKPEYKPTGLDLIKQSSRKIKIPIFAIGGIDQDNINRVKSAGAKRIAVCRAICQSKNMLLANKKLSKMLHLK